MKLYLVDLESYPERYTSWWKIHLPKMLEANGVRTSVIIGESLSDTVNVGTVLDASGTCYYKASQLKQIAALFNNGHIHNGDKFLIADIWFPGIEMIRYMATLYNLYVEIYGVWHAGSTTYMDFAQPMSHWARYFEKSWFNLCDGIFVGSEYSKDNVLLKLFQPQEREAISKKIHAIGMPLDFPHIKETTGENPIKQDAIIFPNRFDREKGINEFLDVIEIMYAKGWKTKTIFTTSRKEYGGNSRFYLEKLSILKALYPDLIEIKDNLPREEYLKIMSSCKAMVSTTFEENFGYCVVEALASGTMPIIKNDFSHPELVECNEDMLFDSHEQLPSILFSLDDRISKYTTEDLRKYADVYYYTIREWVKIMFGNKEVLGFNE